jgi:CDI toxin restriction endonuclease-like domain
MADCALAAAMFVPVGKILEGLDALDAADRALWNLDKFARGYAFEKMVAERLTGSATGWRQLAYGFRTMDFFNSETGAILSLKSLNLGAKSYRSFAGVNRALRGYVDSTAAFTKGVRGLDVIDQGMVTARSLAVVIPSVQLSSQQAWALYSAYEYAASRGIDMTYIVAK